MSSLAASPLHDFCFLFLPLLLCPGFSNTSLYGADSTPSPSPTYKLLLGTSPPSDPPLTLPVMVLNRVDTRDIVLCSRPLL